MTCVLLGLGLTPLMVSESVAREDFVSAALESAKGLGSRAGVVLTWRERFLDFS